MRSTIPLLFLLALCLPVLAEEKPHLDTKTGKIVTLPGNTTVLGNASLTLNGGAVTAITPAGKEGSDNTCAKTGVCIPQTVADAGGDPMRVQNPNSKDGGTVKGQVSGQIVPIDAVKGGAADVRTANIATNLNQIGRAAAGLTATIAPPADTPKVIGGKNENFDYEEMARTAGPEKGPVWTQIGALAQSGDRNAANAAAREALARYPDDVQLQAYVQMTKQQPQTRVTEKTIADRAKELMATLRGDAGAAPPGAGLTASPFGNPSGRQSPALASALAFPALGTTAGAPRALTPMALAEMGRQDSGIRLANPLVRDAISKFMVRDLPGAEILLTQRLGQNPSDEPALRFRALTRRQMGKFEPSEHDATAALQLAPWDARARRVLVDDEVDLGHAQQALEEANEGLRETPNNAEILVARAGAYGALGDREAQLADLKQAAALDSQFDQLYQQALAGPAAPAASKRPHSTVVWLGAVGTALIFFSFVLFRKRGDSSVRLAMRDEDHALLARGARPDAAPAGFRIVKTLGQGGMGVVYEAVDLGLQRTVALKKLRAEIADSPRERARFLKEARTVAGLKHPNIVEIHAIHEDAEGLFLVFEKVQGETLHERLGRGPLPPAEAVAVLRQVAKALDCAHGSGVIHQDLKPANIMVSGEVAKVMDFGIARRVQETLSTLSRIEVAGTPAYMAPEQERGGAVGPAADIFALGACSYELLTGRTPFPNGGMMMKAEKMYRPASDVNPGLTAAADNAIARALEPEPGARWPSATSFVEALARSLS
jgi:tetratricopeptide (TPR) repeat protein